MVKNNVLIMCAFAMGLNLGAEVMAGKVKPQVEWGPMDKFVKRKQPKVVLTPIQKPKNPHKNKLDQNTREAIRLHNAFHNNDLRGLSPMQRAYILKNT